MFCHYVVNDTQNFKHLHLLDRHFTPFIETQQIILENVHNRLQDNLENANNPQQMMIENVNNRQQIEDIHYMEEQLVNLENANDSQQMRDLL